MSQRPTSVDFCSTCEPTQSGHTGGGGVCEKTSFHVGDDFIKFCCGVSAPVVPNWEGNVWRPFWLS